MDNRAIGIFDSGLGGLTAAEVLVSERPYENIIYFGDTGRMPYGGRTEEQLEIMAEQNVNFLSGFDVKLVLAACGTVSSTVLTKKDSISGLPVFGVLQPAVNEAVRSTKNGCIGVIATQATINSRAFESSIHKIMPEARVVPVACPKLVPLVESGHVSPEDGLVMQAVEEYLAPVRSAGADTLILGCTHYPLLRECISLFMGDKVTLVESGAAAAKALIGYMEENGLCSDACTPGDRKYITSGSGETFARAARTLLGEDISGRVSEVEPFKI